MNYWGGTMRGRRTVIATAGLAMLASAGLLAQAAVAQTSAPRWDGVWRNGSNSVHIRARACGRGMCGTVIWASPRAEADARRGGTSRLVGTQIFRDFRPDGALWRGSVFVPDINRTFSGSITVNGRNSITGTGCLLGRIGCRSQTWTRVR